MNPQAFGLDSAQVRRAFERAAAAGGDAAVLQREVERRMFERLDYIRCRPNRVLDSGCGVGHGLKLLRRRYPEADLLGMDFALGVLSEAKREESLFERARRLVSGSRRFHLCADFARLPLRAASMDMVWSNLALSWAGDPLAALREVHRVLVPGGLLMFSSYGPDTLKELKEAFGADSVARHVHSFIDMHDLGDMLVASGFAAPVMDMEVITLTYSEVAALLRDLKASGEIYNLHLVMMGIILVIFVGVFGVMFYSIYAHRKSVGHQAENFHENIAVEVVWAIIPFLILIAVAWPATKSILNLKDTASPDITIKATGYQWKWGYDYLKGEGEGISFLSNLSTPQDQITGSAPKSEHYLLEVDNPMVVPVGKKVRLLLTSNDVIHAWMVPAFGVKQDAIPGFVRDTWFRAEKEGVYRGQCAELCGKDHGFMPIVVEVLSAEKYMAWVGEQKKRMAAAADDPNKKWNLSELKARGEKVYAANCVACHQANGQGVKGTFPALDGSPLVNGPRGRHIEIVLNGKQGTTMAGFGKQLSDTDLAAVITYERNSWSNKTGDVIQPSEINSARK